MPRINTLDATRTDNDEAHTSMTSRHDLQKGSCPVMRSPRKGLIPLENRLSWYRIRKDSRSALERAMGFEPTTTSLGS